MGRLVLTGNPHGSAMYHQAAKENGMATGHVTQVEELDDGTFDVNCTCGWESTGFEDYDDADVTGDEHVANPGE